MIFFLTVYGLYFILLTTATILWLFPKSPTNILDYHGFFSIIIPVRNEAGSIRVLLESIEKQTYKNFEILVIDDHSTDTTPQIVEQFLQQSHISIRLLYLINTEGSPKKRAITQAIQYAYGDLIFTTDGDCYLPPRLLERYASYFSNPRIKFVAGAVTFFRKNGAFFWNRLWNQLQTVEFASLVGTAAVSMQLKHPNMCSGANMAYRKADYNLLKGYEGNFHMASGDDEFLMHKFARRFVDGLHYSRHSDTVVLTKATSDLKSFYFQRKRWASKWKNYQSVSPKLMALFVFLVQVASIFFVFHAEWCIVAIKFFLEAMFVGMVLFFLKRKSSIWYFPLVFVFFPLYIIFFGLSTLGQSNAFIWKGRKLS